MPGNAVVDAAATAIVVDDATVVDVTEVAAVVEAEEVGRVSVVGAEVTSLVSVRVPGDDSAVTGGSVTDVVASELHPTTTPAQIITATVHWCVRMSRCSQDQPPTATDERFRSPTLR
jgi:hypothetical protein